MKIYGDNPVEARKLLGKTQDLGRNQDVEKKEDAHKTDSGRDKVSLSGKSKEIGELKGLIDGIPDIRRDKVEALKEAVDAGTYHFDAVKVVEKIMEEEF